MNSGGRVIGSGRYPAFTAKIRPFYDAPEVEMDWLFYSVPVDAPDGPTTVFTDRFWDHRERWIPPGVGTVPGSEKPYFGPLPPAGVTPLVGTAEQWVNGFSYQTFLDGGYGTTACCECRPGPPLRIRQAQTVTAPWPYRPWAGQIQSIMVAPPAPLFQAGAVFVVSWIGRASRGDQAQTVTATGAVDAFPVIGQAQDLDAPGAIGLPAVASQAQDLDATALIGTASAARQAQTASAAGNVDQQPVIGQAQDLDALAIVGLPAVAGQAQDLDATALIGTASAARQAQRVRAAGAVDARPVVAQAQDLDASGFVGRTASAAQAQDLDASGFVGRTASAAQAQGVGLAGGVLRNVAIGQAQRVLAPGGLIVFPDLAQAQGVLAQGNVDMRPSVAQAQGVGLAGGILAPLIARQAQDVTAQHITHDLAVTSQAQDTPYGDSIAANPGLVCASYQAVVAGQLYAFGSSTVDPQWWGNSSPTAGNYLAWVYITTGTGFICNVYTGNCGSLTLVDTFSVTGSTPVTIAPGDGIYFQVVASSAVVPYAIIFYMN